MAWGLWDLEVTPWHQAFMVVSWLYLVGSAIYKMVVYGRIAASHVVGALVLLALVPVAFQLDLLTMGWLTTIVLLAISWWDIRHPVQGCERG